MADSILFASGDVGGARTLLPIAEVCYETAHPFVVLDHGAISRELPAGWNRISFNNEPRCETVNNLLRSYDIGVVVFASSLKDDLALRVARQAQKLEIPTVHVLDNWTNYRLRMEVDGQPTFSPNVYTVMDDIASMAAIEDGIEKAILAVVGQPALANLKSDFADCNEASRHKKILPLKFNPDKKLIVFVSEPVEHDQGGDASFPQYRGYTEQVVLKMLCESLQEKASGIEIGILPHPREDKERLAAIWHRYKGKLTGGVMDLKRGRDGVFLADAVMGMASILLYEAWLLGKPVASLQPGIQTHSLYMLSCRENVLFVDSYDYFHSMIRQWFSSIFAGKIFSPRPEIKLHEQAPLNVYNIASDLIKAFSPEKNNEVDE